MKEWLQAEGKYKGNLFTLLSASILFKVPKNWAVVGRESPFVMKNCWHAPRTFTCTMVISKRNRHHQNHSKQPGKQRKQDKICLSGAYTRCCYCVKSELFCPRCLNEQLFVAPLRASNVCDDGKIRANECRGKFICTMLSAAEFG